MVVAQSVAVMLARVTMDLASDGQPLDSFTVSTGP